MSAVSQATPLGRYTEIISQFKGEYPDLEQKCINIEALRGYAELYKNMLWDKTATKISTRDELSEQHKKIEDIKSQVINAKVDTISLQERLTTAIHDIKRRNSLAIETARVGADALIELEADLAKVTLLAQTFVTRLDGNALSHCQKYQAAFEARMAQFPSPPKEPEVASAESDSPVQPSIWSRFNPFRSSAVPVEIPGKSSGSAAAEASLPAVSAETATVVDESAQLKEEVDRLKKELAALRELESSRESRSGDLAAVAASLDPITPPVLSPAPTALATADDLPPAPTISAKAASLSDAKPGVGREPTHKRYPLHKTDTSPV